MNKFEIEDYFTSANVNVTKFVKNGLTILFDNEKEAWDYALIKGSYVYPVYNKKDLLIAYGVPK